MTARPVSPGDLDALAELCLEARGESVVTAQICHPSRDVIRQHLAGALQADDMTLLAADVEGAPVGFAIARLVRPGIFCDVGWLQIEAIYVARDQRRRGAGHALMSDLSRIAQEEGAEHVVTMPLTGARSEQRFLARLGFAPAAAHRIAETVSLRRRLDLELVPRERRRPRGLESLIAARRRCRTVDVGMGTDTDAYAIQPAEVPLAAG